jgi:beta-aspartyl-peptidase (threonine type)
MLRHAIEIVKFYRIGNLPYAFWIYLGGLVVALSSGMCEGIAAEESTESDRRWAIVLHGGAGTSPADLSKEANEQRRQGLRQALEVGTKRLSDGGSSLDAVEAVIRVLEDDPQFNAGRGAVYNSVGRHELDASIMDGKTSMAGAVAGVTIVKNPISLARRVMTQTRHVLLAGPGADQFAREQQVELVDNQYFDTPDAKREWEELRAKRQKENGHMGTVGCVALDLQGNLAAGTSTGGLTDKKYGRIGDSPIIGAGTFAQNGVCAISCTGIGELFIRNALAHDVSAQIRYGNKPLDAAMHHAIHEKLEKDTGGMIGVDAQGNMNAQFNTAGMAAALADSTGRLEILW